LARHATALALGLAGAAWVSTASANGRFPRAERVREAPGDASTLTLAGTYGILMTHDHGEHWYHVCEPEFSGQMNYVGDPLFDYTAAGTALVGVQTTLNRSSDDGCSWKAVLGDTLDYVPDYTLSASEPGRVLALTSTTSDGGIVARVAESLDDGATFHALGNALPGTGLTIEVPPSAPDRIYVSGLSAQGEGILMVSGDRGTTWNSLVIAGTSTSEPPYIAAVLASDPDRIFVRTDSHAANDALLFSSDAGAHFQELYRAQAKILGFSLSPDGTSVLVGYGDPVDPTLTIDPSATGAFLSGTGSFAFTRVYSGSVTCLTWTSHGVYVCTTPGQSGFALAQSPSPELDADIDAGTLVPLLHLSDVLGPLTSCPASHVNACVAAWPVACATFGACRLDAGAPDASSPNDAGVTELDASTAGGFAGSTGSAARDAGTIGVTPVSSHPTQTAGGCACSMNSGTRATWPLAAWLLGCLVWRRRKHGGRIASFARGQAARVEFSRNRYFSGLSHSAQSRETETSNFVSRSKLRRVR
jgi:hypothetical protein